MDANTAPDILQVFGDLCNRFSRLTKSGDGSAVPVYGGIGTLLAFLLRRPIHNYLKVIRTGFRSQASVNAVGAFFPVTEMVRYLGGFSNVELLSLKAVSELNIRTQKDAITNNPFFKIGSLVVSRYAVVKALASGSMQSFLASLLFVFVITFVILAIQYVFVFLPRLQRAQLLDDMIQISLENKRLQNVQAHEAITKVLPDAE